MKQLIDKVLLSNFCASRTNFRLRPGQQIRHVAQTLSVS